MRSARVLPMMQTCSPFFSSSVWAGAAEQSAKTATSDSKRLIDEAPSSTRRESVYRGGMPSSYKKYARGSNGHGPEPDTKWVHRATMKSPLESLPFQGKVPTT